MSTDNKSLYDYDPDAQPENEQTIAIVHVSEDYDVYGGRAPHGRCMGETDPSGRGWLGNPYRLANHGRQEAIEKFERAFIDELRNSRAFCNAVVGLPNQRVACHCRYADDDSPPCHLDVVKEALLDGRVYCIADRVHEIPLPDWKQELACDPEVLL